MESPPRSLSVFEREMLEEIAMIVPQEEEEITPEMVLAGARCEAEQKVREAYAEGLRRGLEAAKEQYLASVAESAAALKAAADGFVRVREEFLRSLEPQVVELALDIARRIVQREVRDDSGIVLRTVRRALDILTERESVIVRIHPSDAEALRNEKITLLEEFDGVRQMTLQTDASLSPGGCVVETDLVEIDGRLEAQWEAIRAALLDIAPALPSGSPRGDA